MINEQLVNDILNTVPAGARCCYTGQSILAYVDDPTFSWDEVNTWENETDLDLFRILSAIPSRSYPGVLV